MRFILLTCSIFVWMGCPTNYRKPADFTQDPSDIMAHMKTCESLTKSTSGILKTDTWRDGNRLKLEQMFIRANTGALRIDTLSPIGQPLSTLVFDGGRLLIYDQTEPAFYMGSASRTVIQQFLMVDIEPNALSSLLGGCLPQFPGIPSEVTWDEASGRHSFSITDAHKAVRIWYESGLKVRRVELTEQTRQYTLLMGNYKKIGEQIRPTKLKFIDQKTQLEVDLDLKDLRTLENVSPQTFMLEPPAGLEVRML